MTVPHIIIICVLLLLAVSLLYRFNEVRDIQKEWVGKEVSIPTFKATGKVTGIKSYNRGSHFKALVTLQNGETVELSFDSLVHKGNNNE